MEQQKFKMVNISSYGEKIYRTIILENATIEEVKEKYLRIQGYYMNELFDREFKENENHFTLPNSYNTIHVTKI